MIAGIPLFSSCFNAYNRILKYLSQTLNGLTTSYSYNATNNELKSSSTTGSSISYSYDSNGNLASRTINTSPAIAYAWDAANRLVKVTAGSVSQGAYAYDGLGRRVESVEATTTLYAYSGTESLYELVPGVSSNDFIYASGMRIARVSGITTNYYHTDALGSTRLVTDGSKKILFSDSYQPYGPDNLSSGSETYKFTGKPVSQTTGLYYDYSRWYDPSIGRFISEDSYPGHLSDPQSLNYYVYVENNPVSNADPTGHFLIEALIGAGIGALVGYGWCVATTGGWTSGECGEQAAIGAGTGALIGLTYGLSLVAGAACEEECPQFADAGAGNGARTSVTTASSDASTSSVTITATITSTTSEITTPVITESAGATGDLVQTSAFFLRTEIDAGQINSETLNQLTNGFGIPSSMSERVAQEWVGPGSTSAPSATGVRMFNEPSPGVLQQARIDIGEIQGFGPNVSRIVLERYVNGIRTIGIHLPILG